MLQLFFHRRTALGSVGLAGVRCRSEFSTEASAADYMDKQTGSRWDPEGASPHLPIYRYPKKVVPIQQITVLGTPVSGRALARSTEQLSYKL